MKGTATAKLKSLRMTPRKVRLVVDLIRGRLVQDAMTQLQFSTKHAARPVLKLLQSAVANAANNHQLKKETLRISVAFVDAGTTLHRWMPRAMGRATPIRKRSSHITLVLTGDLDTATVKTQEEKTSDVVDGATEEVTSKKATKASRKTTGESAKKKSE